MTWTPEDYLVAAYVGATAGSWAGGASPAVQNVWVSGKAAGTNLLDSGTLGTANDVPENSIRASWILGNNFAKITVTLDSATPDLYVISEGSVNDAKHGWVDSVQIVEVPEPSSFSLVALGLVSFGSQRWRKKSRLMKARDSQVAWPFANSLRERS